MDKPTNETAKVGNVDVEALSHNIARLIEEGGKALAAYLKPREEGKIKGDAAEDITDVVKSVGRVAEYWMSDPRRALELQTSLGRAYLELWANAVRRMAGEKARTRGRSGPERQAFCRSRVVAKSILRFFEAGVFARHAMGRTPRQRCFRS